MKLLLDECVTRYIKPDLTGHEVLTVDDAGFKGLRNGELLRAVSGKFDVIVTVDRRLSLEHKTANADFGILVLIAKSNRYEDLKPLMSRAIDALSSIKAGEVVEIRS